ncbi:Hachiman antiphage defense system protein HamA [Paraburkholderia sp. RL17-337-BIB-A]|uniref:Hachiman antiphage defense system protein HamA n=1 Tax=Paraburkholderia sp. RL17-337-BIB-A TaxID=3031636 RepID=UPI0038B9AD38
MAKLKDWCDAIDETVNGHNMRMLKAQAAKINDGIDAVALDVPDHYAANARIVRLIRLLGKDKAAEYLEEKLPTGKSIRSGDLGEMLGAAYVAEYTGYSSGVNRLRWKDHREMAMRGDDLLAVQPDPKLKIIFLKGEVKSSVSLSSGTVTAARKALSSQNNRPSPHALSFISDRLHEVGNHTLGDLIDLAQWRDGIKIAQVTHLLFTFSGNDPRGILRKDLNGYAGKVAQIVVGVYVPKHQDFIKAVYAKVVINGV